MVDKTVIGTNFSKSAAFYDSHSRIQNESARVLLDIIGAGDFPNILEIGCGTGFYTKLLAEKYPSSGIVAVDMSDRMINMARKKMAESTVRFMAADGEELTLEGPVDLITSNASFQWFEDLAGSLARYSSFLSDKGNICFSIYGPDTYRELEEVLRLKFGGKDWLSSRAFLAKSDVEKALETCFRSCHIEERHYSVTFGSLMALLREIKLSGARGEGLSRKVFLGKDIIGELEEIYRDRFKNIKATHQIFFFKGEKK